MKSAQTIVVSKLCGHNSDKGEEESKARYKALLYLDQKIPNFADLTYA